MKRLNFPMLAPAGQLEKSWFESVFFKDHAKFLDSHDYEGGKTNFELGDGSPTCPTTGTSCQRRQSSGGETEKEEAQEARAGK
jgi:hypothetical protein